MQNNLKNEESKCKEYRGRDEHLRKSTVCPYHMNTVDLLFEAK